MGNSQDSYASKGFTTKTPTTTTLQRRFASGGNSIHKICGVSTKNQKNIYIIKVKKRVTLKHAVCLKRSNNNPLIVVKINTTTMEKRIELEKRARKASQITDLNLDNCRSTSIVGFTDEYTALESLSLINVGLITLKGFPKLPNLKKLELSDNRISNGLNYLATSPKLQYLNLSGNKIKDLETLKPLEEFKNLAVLDLFNNEATQIDNYREKIFKMIPSLKYLDGLDCNEVEAPSEAEEDCNGNDSFDDDEQMSFSINGLEIDLDELAVLEQRVKAKQKKLNTDDTAGTVASSAASIDTTLASTKQDEIDELDEYLKELQLKEKAKESEPAQATSTNDPPTHPLSFALILYWFLAILNLANAAYYSNSISEDEDGSDDNDDDGDLEEECDEGDVSLSEVYNDELEEDNSDWDEEDAGADDDDDDYDDFDDEEEGATAATGNGETAVGGNKEKATSTKGKSSAADAETTAVDKKESENADADESQTRGKKRKHDG